MLSEEYIPSGFVRNPSDDPAVRLVHFGNESLGIGWRHEQQQPSRGLRIEDKILNLKGNVVFLGDALAYRLQLLAFVHKLENFTKLEQSSEKKA